MSEVPKIVRERLRNMPSEETPMLAPHPDSNLLAAFAEQALSSAEREQVLGHLAICEDCRTAVVLALPPIESIAAPQVAAESEVVAVAGTPKRSWFSRPTFAWPTLRWGALAAGVVVAAALLLHYTGNSNPAVGSRQITPETKSADTSKQTTETASNFETANNAAKLDANVAAQSKPLATAKDKESRSRSLTNKFTNKQLQASAFPAANALVAGRVAGKPTAAPVPAPRRETVEASGASGAAVQKENSRLGDQVMTSSVEQLPLSARNEMPLTASNEPAPPIKKAKAATAAEQSAPMLMAKSGSQPAASAARLASPQTPQFAGVVTDPSGAAVADARVTITNQETGRSILITTNQNGTYAVKELPVGTYQLHAEARGFKSVSDSNVTLSAGLTAHDFKMPLGQSAETVEVSGALASVQTESAKLDKTTALATWSLSAGMLQRSFDGGLTWQTALPDGRLLCYTSRGNEIWAGGKSGLLFRSTDNAASWTQVHPAIGNRALSDDITHLEFRSATVLSLTTGSGATWTSSDGGKTWATK